MLADGQIDLQRIDGAREEGLERPQRAAAVGAEQGAHLLRATLMRGVLAGEHDRGRVGAGMLRLPHCRHRGLEAAAGFADRGELTHALAAHQRCDIGGLVGDGAHGADDLFVQRMRHVGAAHEHGPSSARLLAHPLRDRGACIAQGLQAGHERQRLCRLDHVGAAADQEPRRAHARDQRQRRFELGGEMREIGELGVVGTVAVDDRARGCRREAPQRRRARQELLLGHARCVPVGRPHQQRRLHRVHRQSLQIAISAKAERCCVSGTAPSAVSSTGSPHRR